MLPREAPVLPREKIDEGRVAAVVDADHGGRLSAAHGRLEARGLVGKRLAVERNGEIVPKARHAEVKLADGDRLEIVVAVGGG